MWDVGGQKTIRSYWRNYFEQTDGLIWVVDSADRHRLRDCKDELFRLLSQEVRRRELGDANAVLWAAGWRTAERTVSIALVASIAQKLAGASLLIFANKQDLVCEARGSVCARRDRCQR